MTGINKKFMSPGIILLAVAVFAVSSCRQDTQSNTPDLNIHIHPPQPDKSFDELKAMQRQLELKRNSLDLKLEGDSAKARN